MLPRSRITTYYTDTNYLCLLSVCSVADNLTSITGHNGYTIIALHILISIVSATMAETVVIINNYNCRTSLECEFTTMCNYKLAN